MPNTISTKTYRDVYRKASLGHLLRRALVAEKICEVDRRGLKTISNPYGSTPTVTVQNIVGTYNIDTYQTIDDTLTVDTEIIVAEHVFDFEDTLTNFNMFAARQDQQNFAVKDAIDKFVLNTLAANAGQSYVAPSGGYSTAANFPVMIATLLSMVAGYSENYKGLYAVIESGDLIGIIPNMASSGFNFADAALRNGFMDNFMGVSLYVVRPSTFANYTAGAYTFTNQGKRLFGVKKACTYAEPQGIHFEEKGVSGKTGMEIVTYAYIGAKVWAENDDLTIVITNNGSSPSSSASPSLSPSKSPSKSPSVSPS